MPGGAAISISRRLFATPGKSTFTAPANPSSLSMFGTAAKADCSAEVTVIVVGSSNAPAGTETLAFPSALVNCVSRSGGAMKDLPSILTNGVSAKIAAIEPALLMACRSIRSVSAVVPGISMTKLPSLAAVACGRGS